jgi:protein SCO1/2
MAVDPCSSVKSVANFFVVRFKEFADMTSRSVRFVRRSCAAALTLALAMVLAGGLPSLTPRPAQAAKMSLEDFDVSSYQMGGDFALTNQDGKTTGMRDFRGKAVVMFFGYTYCPDVCPLTLTEIGRMNKLLGKDAGKVQAVFVTIDPERDTAARLKSYLGNFDAGIIALTGSERDITQVAKLYRAKFSKRAASGAGYLVDHTAFVYLVDTKGKVRYLVPYDAGTEILVEGTRLILRG